MEADPDSSAGASTILGAVLDDVVDTLRPPRGDRHGPLAPMMVALTVVTGIVDAVSYLRLGHVFVANMTGNVVFVGFALAGAAGLSARASLAAIAAFLAGAFAGGRLAALSPSHRGLMLRSATGVQAVLLAFALVLALTASSPLPEGMRYALLVALALAMGVQNAAAQRIAVPELTTTVLTRTLTGIASEAGGVAGWGAQLGRRSLAVLAMLTGALFGALLALETSIAAALAPALALVLAVAIAAHLASDPGAEWARA